MMVKLYLLGLHFTVYSLEEPVVDQQLPLNVQFRRVFFAFNPSLGDLPGVVNIQKAIENDDL